jgi:4a-hydroxytetrahydrobiopterin dehydratase
MRNIQTYELHEKGPCWKGYKQIGTKMKGGRIVPRCVPVVKESSDLQLDGPIPDGWTIEDNSLYKKFTFEDFNEAFAFMTDVAKVAKEMNHHPKWTNIYKEVECWLRTHDAGDKITEKDRRMALAIDRII